MKKYLADVIRDFLTICSCTAIGVSIFTAIYSIKSVDTSLFRQIIILSLVASLFNIIFYIEGKFGQLSLIIKIIIHYICIFTLFFSAATLFKWVDTGKISNILAFIFIQLVLYVLAFIFIYNNERKQAKELNSKLDEYKKKRSNDIG
ncbi:MAG: DUF3021 family protein [Bacillota bacterium]|nr:DUF3021 family protein [Bacillota bacterium]